MIRTLSFPFFICSRFHSINSYMKLSATYFGVFLESSLISMLKYIFIPHSALSIRRWCDLNRQTRSWTDYWPRVILIKYQDQIQFRPWILNRKLISSTNPVTEGSYDLIYCRFHQHDIRHFLKTCKSIICLLTAACETFFNNLKVSGLKGTI